MGKSNLNYGFLSTLNTALSTFFFPFLSFSILPIGYFASPSIQSFLRVYTILHSRLPLRLSQAIPATHSLLPIIMRFTSAFLAVSLYLTVTALGFHLHGRDINEPLLESYDYIVVGCGISGLVVSNRLSEIASRTVLCIEAGDALVSSSLSQVQPFTSSGIIMRPLCRIQSMWEPTLVVFTTGTLRQYHRPNWTATLAQCRRARSSVAVAS